MTLVDTLDTLVVVGELNEFERAVRLVVSNVRFDSDFVVSVFETNIRMLGGLLSGWIYGILKFFTAPFYISFISLFN